VPFRRQSMLSGDCPSDGASFRLSPDCKRLLVKPASHLVTRDCRRIEIHFEPYLFEAGLLPEPNARPVHGGMSPAGRGRRRALLLMPCPG
jgi:hypothetical protein